MLFACNPDLETAILSSKIRQEVTDAYGSKDGSAL